MPVSRLAICLSAIREGRARAVEEMFMRKLLPRTKHIWKDWYTPYLKSPSEEAVFGSNGIKEQRETMKLQNEGAMLRNT